MPDDRREIVVADMATMLLNRGMKGNNSVPAVILAAGQANVANDANEPAAMNERSKTMLPDPIEFLQKLLVVLDVPHLTFCIAVFLKRPVGRRRHDEVYAFRREFIHCTSVTQPQFVPGGNAPDGLVYQSQKSFVLCDPGNVPPGRSPSHSEPVEIRSPWRLVSSR